jgi:rsbT co-antagonist protein RsbR
MSSDTAPIIGQPLTLEHEVEQRGNELLDVMMRVAALDYTTRAPVRDDDTVFDALAVGLNMLIDELMAEQEKRARLQEDIIQAQAAALRELSTPLIPVSDDVLAMPLIGAVDSTRARDVLDKLLTGLGASRAHTVILDITGVPLVDTQVANVLIRAAQAAQLLGAQVVLTGMRPEVAQTVVGLGINLDSLVTRSSLQTGIAYAMSYRQRNKPTAR